MSSSSANEVDLLPQVIVFHCRSKFFFPFSTWRSTMVVCTQIAKILLCFKLFVNDSHGFGGFTGVSALLRDFGLLVVLNRRM
jgi:hypothetical protein